MQLIHFWLDSCNIKSIKLVFEIFIKITKIIVIEGGAS
jgi:hypothetical protein